MSQEIEFVVHRNLHNHEEAHCVLPSLPETSRSLKTCTVLSLDEAISTCNFLFLFLSSTIFLQVGVEEECFTSCCVENLMCFLMLLSASTILECRNISVQQLLICIILLVGNAKKQHLVMQKMTTGEH